VRHLEAGHLVPQVVDDAVRVVVAEAPLDLRREAGDLFLVVGAVLGRLDGVVEVGEQLFEGLLHHAPSYARRRLTGAVTTPDDHIGSPRRLRQLVAGLLVGAVALGACSGDDAAPEAEGTTTVDAGPNAGALPTLAGGLELASVAPTRVLTGDGLVYGTPLPSQQAAADAFLEDPEVAAVTARQIYSTRDGRLVGDALVLTLDGAELFDQGVLDAFVQGVAGSLGGDEQDEVELGGRTVDRARGSAGTAIAYVEGDALVVVRGADEHDVGVVVERQLASLAAGVEGAADPQTPLRALPIDAAFVRVPTVTFEAFPPPEDEEPPVPPTLPGGTAVQGRYGVVAGERRTTVWAYTVDPQTYPWAEPLEAALGQVVSERTGGADATSEEVLGRIVHGADGADGEVSARAFRHGGLAIVVEGIDPAQLDGVVSAWIAALNGS
jgi:hypothetical protein